MELSNGAQVIELQDNGVQVQSSQNLQSISFHDITYEVKQSKHCRRINNKVILNSVSGELKPGLNAIMGPTGSGKTSLIDVLADRLHAPMLSGMVLVNCKHKPSNFRSLVGYVVQDDIVLGTLSVRENLYFSASLRLPGSTTWKERKDRVEKVIEELGLQSCAYTKIGNEFLRGVSGGERKRTNIGMELITEPQILFLDEPTTGLDAYTAVSVVSLLKQLSDRGKTVIMSIHQPRYLIFKLFDTLTLLSKGNIVYHGASQKCLQYFENLGFNCENHENPADFFLDTLNRSEGEKDTIVYSQQSGQETINFVDTYRRSDQYKEVRSSIDPALSYEQDSVHGPRSCIPTYPTSFVWQFLAISARSGINLFRNPGTSIIQYVTITFFAFLIGALYFDLGTGETGFQDRIGVLFFIVAQLSFGSLPAIDLFIKERTLFVHEYASGYYGVLPFFLSKVLIDVLVSRLIPNFIFAIVIYFMIGLQVDADRFFIFLLLLILVNMAALSVAFCISALTGNFTVANAMITAVFVVSILFGGVLISFETLGDWIGWMRFFSFARYGVEAIAINEMDGLIFNEFERSCSEGVPVNCTFGGLQRLESLGFETDWLWYDVLALVLYSSIVLTIAYVILLLIKKEK